MHKHHVEALSQMEQSFNMHNVSCMKKFALVDDLKNEVTDQKVKCEQIDFYHKVLS